MKKLVLIVALLLGCMSVRAERVIRVGENIVAQNINVLHVAAIPFSVAGVLGLIFSNSLTGWARAEKGSKAEQEHKNIIVKCLACCAASAGLVLSGNLLNKLYSY